MDVKPSFLPAAIRFRHDKRSSERKLLSTCDGKWYETKLDYDGRVTEHSVRDNNTVSSRYRQSLAYVAAPYGPSSRVSALQFRKVSPNGESAFFALPVSLEYTYDDNGRIPTVTEKQGSVLQPTTTDRAEYTYDAQE